MLFRNSLPCEESSPGYFKPIDKISEHERLGEVIENELIHAKIFVECCLCQNQFGKDYVFKLCECDEMHSYC